MVKIEVVFDYNEDAGENVFEDDVAFLETIPGVKVLENEISVILYECENPSVALVFLSFLIGKNVDITIMNPHPNP